MLHISVLLIGYSQQMGFLSLFALLAIVAQNFQK